MAQRALSDLQETKNYISQDKPDAAMTVIQRVLEAIEHIAVFPGIGRTGRVPRTKELVVSGTPLLVVYQVKHDTLFIVRIIHTARKWP
jgi:addiction module RelE/StbE family toxin